MSQFHGHGTLYNGELLNHFMDSYQNIVYEYAWSSGSDGPLVYVCYYVVGHAVQGGHCPRGYDNMFNGTCYLLSHDKATWIGAMVRIT